MTEQEIAEKKERERQDKIKEINDNIAVAQRAVFRATTNRKIDRYNIILKELREDLVKLKGEK